MSIAADHPLEVYKTATALSNSGLSLATVAAIALAVSKGSVLDAVPIPAFDLEGVGIFLQASN